MEAVQISITFLLLELHHPHTKAMIDPMPHIKTKIEKAMPKPPLPWLNISAITITKHTREVIPSPTCNNMFIVSITK